MKKAALALVAAAGLSFGIAGAKPPQPPTIATPTATPTATPAPAASVAGSVGGCVEIVPPGAQKSILIDRFPARGYSGYAATLVVTVEHGKGESVLPQGLELQSESDAAKALRQAGFVIPDQNGVDAARLKTEPKDPKNPDRIATTLELPLLALPPQPGRHTLTLPSLPVAVSRANGEIATACTQPHTIVIEDPTSSTPDPQPRPNPGPRPQREEWTALRKALTYGTIGLLAGAILAYLFRKWSQRPRPVVPPPPPRPPWEIALERLDEVRHAGLLDVARFQEYFDRVNDAVRAYLGARYGFDGLESTTDEILQGLRRATFDGAPPAATDRGPQQAGASPASPPMAAPSAFPGDAVTSAVVQFLAECDLVKFAKFTPTPEECARALEAAERIVRSTTPWATGGSVDRDVAGPTANATVIDAATPTTTPEPTSETTEERP
jgi:hypothetical protein